MGGRRGQRDDREMLTVTNLNHDARRGLVEEELRQQDGGSKEGSRARRPCGSWMDEEGGMKRGTDGGTAFRGDRKVAPQP